MKHEIVINLHMHTLYSDGHGTHEDIAKAALRAGLDAVIVTDHNIWVEGVEGYHSHDGDSVLVLVGEEVHDQTCTPQKNHLLIFGADSELESLAGDPQTLIDAANQAGALTFIAHPTDPAAPAFNEPDLSWVDWDINGYTGIELWNAMSEFKSLLSDKLRAVYYAFNPRQVASAPFEDSLNKWDSLLNKGMRVVAIGGSDAHAMPGRLGPLRRTLFPYEFHFRAINTHVFTSGPLHGDVEFDRAQIYTALRQGHAFVGYDLPASTAGFKFKAQGVDSKAWMGDEIPAKGGVTLQIRLPHRVECNLLKDGQVIKTWHDREICAHSTTEPGVYRVEAYIHYRGKRRGWIFSNPIYLR
ncbi:MAG: CehA/McbA family metallohydrolase [Chloroflexota bacterium]